MGSNADAIRRLITEAWTGQDTDLVDELVATTYHEHAPFGDVIGHEGYREGIDMFGAAFGPVRLELHEVIEQADRVAARFTFRGHHGGDFMGVPPSGVDVSMDGISITRFEAGKVVEEWLQIDLLGLMQQIGAVPTPPDATG